MIISGISRALSLWMNEHRLLDLCVRLFHSRVIGCCKTYPVLVHITIVSLLTNVTKVPGATISQIY